MHISTRSVLCVTFQITPHHRSLSWCLFPPLTPPVPPTNPYVPLDSRLRQLPRLRQLSRPGLVESAVLLGRLQRDQIGFVDDVEPSERTFQLPMAFRPLMDTNFSIESRFELNDDKRAARPVKVRSTAIVPDRMAETTPNVNDVSENSHQPMGSIPSHTRLSTRSKNVTREDIPR